MHMCLTWIWENSKFVHMNTTSEYFLKAISKLLTFAWQENEGGLDTRDMESDWNISTRYHWAEENLWNFSAWQLQACEIPAATNFPSVMSLPWLGNQFSAGSKLISYQERHPSTLPECTDSMLEDTRACYKVILVRYWEGRSGKLLITHQTEICRPRDYSDCASGKK